MAGVRKLNRYEEFDYESSRICKTLPDAAKILKKAANEVRKLAKGDESGE